MYSNDCSHMPSYFEKKNLPEKEMEKSCKHFSYKKVYKRTVRARKDRPLEYIALLNRPTVQKYELVQYTAFLNRPTPDCLN